MPKFTKDTEVLVGKKKLKVGEILSTIIYLPSSQILEFFNSIGLTVPRELRIFVLRENLREKVSETRKSRITLADELNYRLSWFTEYTETQLENLLVFFDDQKTFKKYLEELWTDLLGYMVEKQVPEFEIEKIYKQSLDFVKENKLVLPNLANYNLNLNPLFFDSYGRIDGVSPNKIRNVLYKSATLNEIRELGAKYGVNVPKRLKKNELADIIISELKDKGEYTEALENQIKSMSVIIMQRFAIDHDIKASTELKKEEVIEYILKHAQETKETYFVPTSRDVYEKDMNDETLEEKVETKEEKQQEVQEETSTVALMVETVVEEPVSNMFVEEIVEEVVEEVIEEKNEPMLETKTETKKEVIKEVEYVAPNINLDALVDEVKKLRETVQSFKTEMKNVEVEKVYEAPSKKEVKPLVNGNKKIINVNSAEFYGTDKDFTKLTKIDESHEREAYVEKIKNDKKAMLDTHEKNDAPIELKIMSKIFKFLFRWILILGSILIGLILIYSLLDYFINLSLFDSFTNTLNGFQIAGKGIIQWLFDLYNLLGLTQNI